jgi:hypothetical protein
MLQPVHQSPKHRSDLLGSRLARQLQALHDACVDDIGFRVCVSASWEVQFCPSTPKSNLYRKFLCGHTDVKHKQAKPAQAHTKLQRDGSIRNSLLLLLCGQSDEVRTNQLTWVRAYIRQ